MIAFGDVLLGGAIASAAAALAIPKWRELAVRAHTTLILLALAWIVVDLLAGTLQHRYVWDHTRVDYPFFYKLAGLWGGEEGTVLLWNAVIATALLFVRHARPRILLLVASGAFALLGILFRAFEPTSAADLAQAPFGRGLADVLVTPLMVIHPPVQFVAYGLMAVPAAYAIASLWDPPGDGAWAGHAYPWARRAWLFATLGLGLGALWAYYVLSFGGYWAWDPVETSNLLPWLALTAFLHAGKLRMRGQGQHLAAPILAFSAFALTLFATFATRSGLWVSVHAFTDPTDRFEPDAGARLLAILDVHLPTRAFLAILTAAILASAGLFAARRIGSRLWGGALLALAGAALLAPRDLWSLALHAGSLVAPLPLGLGILFLVVVALPFLVAFARGDEEHPRVDVNVRILMATAVALLAIAVGVTFLLDLQIVNGPDRDTFDRRAPFVAVPIATVVTIMLALAPFGKRAAVALGLGALAAGVGAAIAFPDARVLALAIPIGSAATLAAVAKLVHVQGRAASPPLRIAGTLVLVASLLGLLQGSNPPTYVLGRTIPEGASLALGLAGIAIATAGLVLSTAIFRGSRALGIAAALAAALSIGYGLGALLAIAALALLLRSPDVISPGGHSPGGRLDPARVRETGIYLVHLALVLGLLGFAASTYSQEVERFVAVPLDANLDVGEYAITLRDPQVEATAGAIDAFTLDVGLARNGRDAGAEEILFEWKPRSGIYSGVLDVRRSLTEDVYVRPLAFRTPEGWVGADSAAGDRAAASGVDAVTFSVSVLPLMSLVWASTWMMVIGMGMIIVSSRDRS